MACLGLHATWRARAVVIPLAQSRCPRVHTQRCACDARAELPTGQVGGLGVCPGTQHHGWRVVA